MENGLVSTYHDIERMLLKICSKYKGGKIQWDDLVATARLGYMKAFRSYDPSMADFTTWAYRKVKNEIQNEFRKINKVPQLTEDGNFDTPCKVPTFNFKEWKETLSEDARQAIELLIAPKMPAKMKRLYKKVGGVDEYDKMRSALREYLIRDLKWKRTRVRKCFNEIREKLKDK